MADQSLDVAKALPLDDFGIVGFGGFVHDLIIDQKAYEDSIAKYSDGKEDGKINLPQGTAFRVRDKTGHVIGEISGPFRVDAGTDFGYSLARNEKHTSLGKDASNCLEFIVGENCTKRPGGGMVNFATEWLSHSSEIPMAIAAIRGKGKIDDLLDDCFMQNFQAVESRDSANIVIPKRTIIRDQPLTYKNHFHFRPSFPFKIGSVVINSLDNAELTKVAVNYYLSELKNGHHVGGLIAITPKMANSYDFIRQTAIPSGFIPLFSSTDIITYAFHDDPKKSELLAKREAELTYSDILSAVSVVRKQQGDNPQRIYVTLGPNGALAVGTASRVYRVAAFNVHGDNLVGAGDTFASMVARYEYKKNLSMRDYQPVYSILAYASVAAALHIDRMRPSLGAIYKRMTAEKQLHFEEIGHLSGLNLESPMYQRTLAEVGVSPVTGKFDALRFS